MRYCFLILTLAVVALAGCGCDLTSEKREPKTGTGPSPSGAPGESQKPATSAEPLLLDNEQSLFGESQDGNSPAGPVADNSRCHVCHINYTQEDIAVIHAKAGIGCADCHGDSDAHIADESWASGGNGTAPDIMYPRSKINSACMSCHPRDNIDTVEHEPLLAGTEDKVCTDCHGSHRLARRRCKWK